MQAGKGEDRLHGARQDRMVRSVLARLGRRVEERRGAIRRGLVGQGRQGEARQGAVRQ